MSEDKAAYGGHTKGKVTDLPPCRVCGETASGFHYGVNTCEACKGFFRRSIKRTKEYKCLKNAKCFVEGRGKNNKCPKCRFQLCLNVGMSKDDIKIGRYTHERRTKYTLELKGEDSSDMTSVSSSEESLSRQSSIKSIELPDIFPKLQLECNLQEHIDQMMAQYCELFQLSEFEATKEEMERSYIEENKLREELFGVMAALTIDEYLDFKSSTGMDIDGRIDILQGFNEYAERHGEFLITAAGLSPNFDSLTTNDKVELVQHFYRSGAFLILTNSRFNFDKDIYHSPCNRILSKTTLKMVFPEKFVDDAFALGLRLDKLGLTLDEVVVASCVYVLMANGVELQEPEKVEQTLHLCVDMLLYLLDRNHPGDHMLYPKLISLFTEFQNLRMDEELLTYVETTFDVKFHTVVYELLDLSVNEWLRNNFDKS